MRTPDKEHRKIIEDWIKANPYKAEAYREATIEECAHAVRAVLDEIHFTKENDVETALLSAIAAIRSLKDMP